jgi:undecaprenyl-diphosphatase
MPAAARPLALLLFLVAPFAFAQDGDPPVEDPPPSRGSLDARLVRSINAVEDPAFAGYMRAVDWSSLKTFYTIAPVMSAAALLTGSEMDPPLQMAASEAATVALVFGAKWALKRPRPYAAPIGVTKRTPGAPGDEFDPYSFPSGHSAMAFSVATSLSLAYPKWYVIGPSYLWASSIAVSRMWLGVHYPSDVVVGALLGTGVSFGVFLIFEALETAVESGDESADPIGTPPMVSFRIGL